MLRIRPEFKLQDMWVGVFWKHYPAAYNSETYDNPYWNRIELWICLVPCVPIHIIWQGPVTWYDREWDAPPNVPDDGVRP